MSGMLLVDGRTPASVVTSLVSNISRCVNGGMYVQEGDTWTPVVFSRDLQWADLRSFARTAGWTWDIGYMPGGVWGTWRVPTSNGHFDGRVTFLGRHEVEIAGPLPGPFYTSVDPTPKTVLELAYMAVYVAASSRSRSTT